MPLLVRVELPGFVAGCEVRGERIVSAAPILGWWVGQSPQALAAWVVGQGGSIAVVSRYPRTRESPPGEGGLAERGAAGR